MTYLRPLPSRGTIGIMAPSSPVEKERLHKGASYFEKLGYQVHITSSCYARDNYLAGSAEMRASELMELINNPSIDTIFFARGGFGSAAMLPLLDFPAIKKAAKLMIGYSDITSLQWGIYTKTGLPSLSTGMPATDFDGDTVHPQFEEKFWQFMETGKIDYTLNVPANKQNGQVKGTLLPGTLSVVTKLAGSPYIPDFINTIPLFEDVGESRHKIEGYLQQAKLAGWFNQSSAVLLGSFSEPEQETFPDNPSLEKVFKRIFDDPSLPLAMDLPYGHIDHKIPFPLGVEISLSFGKSVTLTSTQSIFSS